MNISFDTSNLKAYFTFPLKGKAAGNRLLVGLALMIASMIIPVIPALPVLGYYYRMMQRKIRDNQLEMPAWDEWGQLFIDGLKFMVVNIVYTLPATIVYFAGFTLYFVAMMSMAFSGGRAESEMVCVPLLGMAILFLSMFVAILLALAGGIPLPFAVSHAIARDRLSAAFELGTITRLIRRKTSDYLVAFIVLTGLVIVLSLFLRESAMIRGAAGSTAADRVEE